MLSCYRSKQSLYLAGVMLPGKTVKSIPSASPSVKLLLRRDFTESTLCCDCCYDVKNRLLEKKNINPRRQSGVKISEWVPCLTDLPAFDLTYDLCLPLYIDPIYKKTVWGSHFNFLQACMISLHQWVAVSLCGGCFKCWDVWPLTSVVLFRCVLKVLLLQK